MLSSSVLPCDYLWVPYHSACWWHHSNLFVYLSLSLPPNYPHPSQTTSVPFPAPHWPEACFLKMCHCPKRKRLQEIWKWHLPDCRLRRKCRWLQTLCCEGSVLRFQVNGQTVWVSSRGGCEVRVVPQWRPLGVTHAAYWLDLSHSCYRRFISILVNRLTFQNKTVTNGKSCDFFGFLCII